MKEDNKFRRIYLDWWTIKKSTIYVLVILLALLGGVGFGGWYLWKNANLTLTPEVPINAAKVMSFEGDVRIIRATTRETERVVGTVYVAAGDTVQTQSDGKAQLQMIDGSTLTIRPNSTVIIRDNTSILGGTTSVKVSLGDGQINVKTEEQNAATNNIVEVKQVENKIAAQTDASFGVNPATSTGEIRISRGSVESNAGGEKTIIKNGEYAAINTAGRVSQKEKLADPPKLISPNGLEQFFVGDSGKTDVTLRWQKPEVLPVSFYRAEVGTSPFFVPDGIVVQQEPLKTPNLTLAKLSAGNYFWRIRSVTNTGQISEWSEPRKFTVSTRDGSGKINLSDLKVDSIGGNLYMLSGKTSPGASIRVLGKQTIAVGDGSFKMQLTIPGNEVAIDALDEHGGKTRYSFSISTGKFSRIN
jgi:copper chaperone CopZ